MVKKKKKKKQKKLKENLLKIKIGGTD